MSLFCNCKNIKKGYFCKICLFNFLHYIIILCSYLFFDITYTQVYFSSHYNNIICRRFSPQCRHCDSQSAHNVEALHQINLHNIRERWTDMRAFCSCTTANIFLNYAHVRYIRDIVREYVLLRLHFSFPTKRGVKPEISVHAFFFVISPVDWMRKTSCTWLIYVYILICRVFYFLMRNSLTNLESIFSIMEIRH